MSSRQPRNKVQAYRTLVDTRPAAIKACLDYLYREALACNMALTAHLIGAAAESVVDRLSGRDEPRLPARASRRRRLNGGSHPEEKPT